MSPGFERTERRYFWGQTLRQALSRAARVHQIAPEELDYRPVEIDGADRAAALLAELL